MSGWVGEWAEWRRELAAAIALGLFLGAIGPFGTWSNGGGLALRLGYWVGAVVAGLVLYGLAARLALHWGERLKQPVWFTLPLAVLVASLPMSLITSTTVLALWPGVRGHVRPFDWYGQAALMGFPLSIAILWSRRVFPVHSAAAPSAPDGDSFLDRLPPRLGRNFLCLQMEDHYVRAHTDRGSDLILMPLKDAIAGLNGIEGMQVHRSWWVARAAVTGPVRRGRAVALRLSNGLEAPVARSAIARLRANHWLDSAFDA